MMLQSHMAAAGGSHLLLHPRYMHMSKFDRSRTAQGVAAAAPPSAASGPCVMVVESPTKARKIQQFLGESYTVLPSYGHVRDLAPTTGAVLPEEDFAMTWQLTTGAGPRLQEIETALKQGGRGKSKARSRLILATDPDREGEAISWHVEQELQARGALQACQVERVTFTEITPAAVADALQNPRQVSVPLVDAYLARRALDYLVGFHLSPVLWRRLPGAKSAGRVQSVALRLICEREAAVEAAVPVKYFRVEAVLEGPAGQCVPAVLTSADGEKLQGTDLGDSVRAQQLVKRVKNEQLQVLTVKVSAVQRSPQPPFITSTLQRAASSSLGFGAQRTMRAAQSLYEGDGSGEGLITYMRTDGVQLSPAAVAVVRNAAEKLFGASAIPKEPRVYTSRVKNAQEAHEAIRPTDMGLAPTHLPSSVGADARAVYDLIWRRTLASQMGNAVMQRVAVDVGTADRSLVLHASASSVQEPGFLAAMNKANTNADEEQEVEDASDPSGAASGEDSRLSASGGARMGKALAKMPPASAALLQTLKKGDLIHAAGVEAVKRQTLPPARYSEGSIIKALEDLGIGRPSTYAPILQVLQARGYVQKEIGALRATSLGRILSVFLEAYFAQYVQYSYTSDMEASLDNVAGGGLHWKKVLQQFWEPFTKQVQHILTTTRTSDVYDMLDAALSQHFFPPPQHQSVGELGQLQLQQPDSPAPLTATTSGSTSDLVVKTTAITSSRAGNPEAAVSGQQETAQLLPSPAYDPRTCPRCRQGRLVLKPSRYGGFFGCTAYDKAGGTSCGYARPLIVSHSVLVENADGDTTLVFAEPSTRELGLHPVTGTMVYAKLGPFGPYVEMATAPDQTEPENGGSDTACAQDASSISQQASSSSSTTTTLAGSPASTVSASDSPVGSTTAVGKKRGRPAKAVQLMQADVGGTVSVTADTTKAKAKGKKRKTPVTKPRRAALGKGMSLDDLTLEMAVALLSLPRVIGVHPDDQQPISVHAGRFGPYVSHEGASASLGKHATPDTIDVPLAVSLLAKREQRVAARLAKSGGMWSPRGGKTSKTEK